MRHLRRFFVALSVLCLLPLASVLVSATIAALAGCELNEASTSVCSIAGLDIGGVLSAMFVLGWTALVSLPVLLGVLIVWGLIEAWTRWRARRNARKAIPAALEN